MGMKAGSPQDVRWGLNPPKRKVVKKSVLVYKDNPAVAEENSALNKKNTALSEEVESLKLKLKKTDDSEVKSSKKAKKVEKKVNVPKSDSTRKQG